jgi:DNA polymerase elongation subunit (family B)
LKILLLDIETAPNQVYSWGVYDQNIAMNQIRQTSYVLCWAAKFLDEKKVYFDSVKKSKPEKMLNGMHKLLDEAHVVVHYNGLKFDIPTLNKEFIKKGFPPPSPYKQVDCLKEVRRLFRFEMNKMDFVTQTLQIGAKTEHEGFALWVKCMEGDERAWKRMEKYNRQDLRLLEALYLRLRPWMDKHPNHGAHDDFMCCPKCGGEKYQHRGYSVTQVMKYRRYQCLNCGAWFRDNKTVTTLKERAVNIAA